MSIVTYIVEYVTVIEHDIDVVAGIIDATNIDTAAPGTCVVVDSAAVECDVTTVNVDAPTIVKAGIRNGVLVDGTVVEYNVTTLNVDAATATL